MMLKIVSGGQTGVDRAALDFALEQGIPCGGWCPKDRAAEDGRIPDRYPLQEVTGGYRIRTERNVVDSDATLILIVDKLSGGTLLTRNLCRKHMKPHLVVKLTDSGALDTARRWLRETEIAVLNVAGPRESGEPGIHEKSVDFLRSLFPTHLTPITYDPNTIAMHKASIEAPKPWTDLVDLLLEETRRDLFGRFPVYVTEGASMWDDLAAEAEAGLPIPLSNMLVRHVEEVLLGAVKKLPMSAQESLWWITAQGTDFLSEVECAWHNDPGDLPNFVVPSTEERLGNIVDHLRKMLEARAESGLYESIFKPVRG